MTQNTQLIPVAELQEASGKCHKILAELDKILVGRPQLHRMVLIGILSRGHILLEGLPGVGKTALIKTLGQLMSLEFSRVQFTPDLMPGDILGAHILQQDESGRREMTFQPGPIFTNILLADEINRASPKTQSALLEAMQERSVTLMGKTRMLPLPFFVLASQNPIELEGTYPLPEAQLDRFLFKLEVKNADVSTLKEIIFTRRHGQPP
ncbi:MAG: AAA family ATPase, partial [Candidatus Riflebacteria bacterium]